MKKVMIALMMAVTTSTACFANASNDDVQKAAKEVAQAVKKAPSGTTYGMSAKLISVKNGVYKVKTSLGTFSVNTHKATVTKQ